MPTRANKRSGLVFLRVDKTTSWASRCRARRSQRLLRLPLLILVAAALTTVHSESYQLQKFPSFLWPPNQTQMQYTNSGFPLIASSKRVPPQVSSPSPELSDGISSETTKSSTNTDIDSEQDFVLNHNNNGNHAILVGENSHQLAQLQDLYLPKNKIQPNTASKHSTAEFTLKSPEVSSQSFDQMQQHQYVVPDFNEKPIVAETNFENVDQQLRTSNLSSVDGEQLVSQKVVNQLGNVKSSENIKDFDDSGHKVLDKRFGLFKKGQASNNNLPSYNFGAVSLYDDCERCLNNAGLGSTQTASWMHDSSSSSYRQHQHLPPTPHLAYPIATHNAQPHIHNLGPFKNKLNKFLLQKPRTMGDYNFGKSYLSNYKYKPSLPVGRNAYRTQLNQPLNCIQQFDLAGFGPFVNQGLPDSVQLDDVKISPQTSYSNSLY